MSCEEYRIAIVELARRGKEGLRPAGLSEHLLRCASCAALLEQQQALTAGLRALAAATRVVPLPGPLENRVLAAAESIVRHDPAATPKKRFERNKKLRPMWLSVAAAASLVIGGGAIWFTGRGALRDSAHQAPNQARAPETASVTSPRLSPAPGPDVAASSSPIPHPGAAEASRAAASPAGTIAAPAGAGKMPSRGLGASRRGTAARPESRTADAAAQGFVPLPWAALLPEVDRGEIVRTEIPVPALPLYGIAIAPDALDRAVKVDLLVGQDGQPRAIRLVTGAEAF